MNKEIKYSNRSVRNSTKSTEESRKKKDSLTLNRSIGVWGKGAPPGPGQYSASSKRRKVRKQKKEEQDFRSRREVKRRHRLDNKYF